MPPKEWQVIKAKEDYCLRHEIPFPHFNRLAGRPVKPSPLYERLKAKGAVFEEVYGHRTAALVRKRRLGAARSLFLQPAEWFDMVAIEEMKAVRERRRHHGYLRLHQDRGVRSGRRSLLDRLTANRCRKKVGGIALTHMLNRRGRIELEPPSCGLAEDRFYLVCAAFFEQRLIDHLAQPLTGETVTVKLRLTGGRWR
jgi:dimethylglycine dehydrogenase